MARPFKDDKKISIGVRLPPWLNEWFKDREHSKSIIIERSIRHYYSISDSQVDCYALQAEKERIKKNE